LWRRRIFTVRIFSVILIYHFQETLLPVFVFRENRIVTLNWTFRSATYVHVYTRLILRVYIMFRHDCKRLCIHCVLLRVWLINRLFRIIIFKYRIHSIHTILYKCIKLIIAIRYNIFELTRFTHALKCNFRIFFFF